MQKGHILEFNCIGCQSPVQFSVFEVEQSGQTICCQRCEKQYVFNDETLQRQLQKFEALCRQIRDSEEILSNTSVGINVGTHQVEVPYRLLLTRLSSKLQLHIGNESISIAFRLEPIHDIPVKEEVDDSNKGLPTRMKGGVACGC